jgi:hypothetical protein
LETGILGKRRRWIWDSRRERELSVLGGKKRVSVAGKKEGSI